MVLLETPAPLRAHCPVDGFPVLAFRDVTSTTQMSTLFP